MPTKKASIRMNKQREIEIKKRKRRKRIIITILILAIITGIYAYLLNSETFKIKDIEITGYNLLTQEKIYELCGVKLGDSIFSNLNIVTKVRLKQNGYIQDAKVSKKYPNTLIIEVQERQMEFQIQTQTGYYIYIDEQGYIIDCSTQKLDLITLVGMDITENEIEGKHRLEDDDLNVRLEKILHIKQEMTQIGIFDKVAEIQINGEYIVNLNDGITIKLGDASDLKNRMYYVKAILNAEAGKTGTINVNGNLNEGFTPYFTENSQ